MVMRMRPLITGILILVLLAALVYFARPILTRTDPPKKSRVSRLVPPPGASESPRSFFPYYRLQRERVRSQRLELLREIANNPNAGERSRQAALNGLLEITGIMEKEMKAEALLRAEGIKDGVVIITAGKATAILCTASSLAEGKKESIKNRLSQVLGLEAIHIELVERGGRK